MKKSIRLKLFLGTSSLIIFFVFSLWLFNAFGLEKYYISEKKNMLIKNSSYIDGIYKGEPENIELELRKLESSNAVNITIADKSNLIKYITSPRNNFRTFNGPRRMPRSFSSDKYTSKKYTFETQDNEELKIEYLTLATVLNNGDILLLRSALPAIKESVNIAGRFMAFTGIITLILCIIWAYLFSRKFTKPILELNEIADNMSNLNFLKKCSIKSDDELGQLGKSINNLSGKLDTAISELNEKNKKLTMDIEKERKIDEMRKQFVSNVSHELKTPISLIQGYAEGLSVNVIDSEEDKKFYCNVIINESARMSKLVKDLLNLSQIESGYYKIDKVDFNISSLIEQVAGKFKAVFDKKKINLIINKNAGVIVNADIVRTEQILINYISNAINYVNDKRVIKIEVDESGDKVRVFVFNTGDHIPENVINDIWTSFYKVDSARTRKYGGSGLGLSIVKGIQELHGNGYGTENMEGGVRFWFDINKSFINL